MKIIKKQYQVHLILECLICDWKTQDYKIGDQEALKHIREMDHEIRGEIGYAVDIYGT